MDVERVLGRVGYGYTFFLDGKGIRCGKAVTIATFVRGGSLMALCGAIRYVRWEGIQDAGGSPNVKTLRARLALSVQK